MERVSFHPDNREQSTLVPLDPQDSLLRLVIDDGVGASGRHSLVDFQVVRWVICGGGGARSSPMAVMDPFYNAMAI